MSHDKLQCRRVPELSQGFEARRGRVVVVGSVTQGGMPCAVTRHDRLSAVAAHYNFTQYLFFSGRYPRKGLQFGFSTAAGKLFEPAASSHRAGRISVVFGAVDEAAVYVGRGGSQNDLERVGTKWKRLTMLSEVCIDRYAIVQGDGFVVLRDVPCSSWKGASQTGRRISRKGPVGVSITRPITVVARNIRH